MKIKYKVIFLDIDGVLNGYNFWSMLGWKLVCLTHSDKIKNWYRTVADPCGVHESKVRRLAKVIHQTNAKVVMSSSWRDYFWKVPYEKKHDRQKKLVDLLNKYNIEIIDITPHSTNGQRDAEILTWLAQHENEVENFIILDDENSFLKAFHEDKRFIQTSSVPKGKIIMGFWYEDTGLKNKHVKPAIDILNNYTI